MIYEELFEDLLLKDYKSAVEICEKNGFTTRVVCNNGVNYVITCDFNLKRVNFVLENGIIVKCDIG